MQRNIDEAGESATVWKGQIESKTTICPVCGKPAGTGKFCNNCGASMALKECSRCGALQFFQNQTCTACGKKIKNKIEQKRS